MSKIDQNKFWVKNRQTHISSSSCLGPKISYIGFSIRKLLRNEFENNLWLNLVKNNFWLKILRKLVFGQNPRSKLIVNPKIDLNWSRL